MRPIRSRPSPLTRIRRRSALTALALVACAAACSAQQDPDRSYAPAIPRPSFAPGRGPLVLIDEGHHEFHTRAGRYSAFANLIERDGFVVRAHAGRLDRASLGRARVLVVANALAARNEQDWSLPVDPAFDEREVTAVRDWVRDGGALFLVADHMPFPGAAAGLAAAFGFRFENGFAYDAAGRSTFDARRDAGLHAGPVADGRGADERVDSVRVFTGQAFRADAAVDTIVSLGAGAYSLFPRVAWEFSDSTRRESSAFALVGAARNFGRGRVVVFGEAAMFTAQVAGPNRVRMGMNDPGAPHNHRLALNVVRWLAGVLD